MALSPASSRGGSSLPAEYTFGPDGTLTVVDNSEFASEQFIIDLTDGDEEVWARHIRVYSGLIIDDATMVATSDNGPTCFEIDPTGNGIVEVAGTDVGASLAALAALLSVVDADVDSIGFYGATPIPQQAVAAIADPPTATAEEVATAFNLLLAALVSLGLVAAA